ncbi:3460_t:CDS:2 [Acaulospora morrowiae]|uniref:3460_t:CDS:1 n=1 Tax=Acaulospora morrowiae TaxID=94023 RepID=A0A9N9FWI5_9GLOM|nr:3460_t:CDS:2 [Acaulospora morrowiae]
MSKAKIDLANLDFSQVKGNQSIYLTVPVPQATHCMEVTVAGIVRQLGNWNIQIRQNEDVKTSQGGFNFSVEGRKTINVPDISFTPKSVGDIAIRSTFEELDDKFKREYFADGTSVQLGWLVDPKNRRIWESTWNIFRRERAWEDV